MNEQRKDWRCQVTAENRKADPSFIRAGEEMSANFLVMMTWAI